MSLNSRATNSDRVLLPFADCRTHRSPASALCRGRRVMVCPYRALSPLACRWPFRSCLVSCKGYLGWRILSSPSASNLLSHLLLAQIISSAQLNRTGQSYPRAVYFCGGKPSARCKLLQQPRGHMSPQASTASWEQDYFKMLSWLRRLRFSVG